MITDELRDCIRTANRSYEDVRNPYNDREILHIPDEELLAIADRIDAEHEKAVTAAHSNGITKYGSMVAREYVKLPVDADGVPIHVGDTMEWLDGSTAEVIGIGDGVFFYKDDESDSADWSSAKGKHHVKPDSWERIIQDAVSLGYADYPTTSYEAELVERCKRLAGEA